MKKLILSLSIVLLTINAQAVVNLEVINTQGDDVHRSYLRVTNQTTDPQEVVYLFPNRMVFVQGEESYKQVSVYHFQFQTYDCLMNKPLPSTIRDYRLTGVENLEALRTIMEQKMIMSILASNEQYSYYVTYPPSLEMQKSIATAQLEGVLVDFLDRVNE